jgi:hypothetical protein
MMPFSAGRCTDPVKLCINFTDYLVYVHKQKLVLIVDRQTGKYKIIDNIEPVMTTLDSIMTRMPPWSPEAIDYGLCRGLPGTSGYHPQSHKYGPAGTVLYMQRIDTE